MTPTKDYYREYTTTEVVSSEFVRTGDAPDDFEKKYHYGLVEHSVKTDGWENKTNQLIYIRAYSKKRVTRLNTVEYFDESKIIYTAKDNSMFDTYANKMEKADFNYTPSSTDINDCYTKYVGQYIKNQNLGH